MSAPVEVCFVSYLSGDDLVEAIESVSRHVPNAVIAVQEHGEDDRSLIAAAERAAALGLEFRGIHDPANRGFGAGCNSLARTSDAEWLLFLNPDARVTSWPFGHDEPSPRAVLGPERFQGAHPGSHRGEQYRIRDEVARSWFRRDGRAPQGRGFVSGAALLVHRDDHEHLGGFDERYFLFYEDIDFCLRANDAGIATHLAPGWVVHHAGGHSTSPRFGAALLWSYESGTRFHDAHRESTSLYRLYIVADSSLRFVVQMIRRDPIRRSAYATLFRRACHDLLHREPA